MDHKEVIDQFGSLDELLYFCGLTSNCLRQKLVEVHKLYDSKDFLDLSKEELLYLGFEECSVLLLVDGAILYVEKLDDYLFKTSESDEFRDYPP